MFYNYYYCWLLTFFSLSGIVCVVSEKNDLPTVNDQIMSPDITLAESLRAIHQFQNKLYQLESELTEYYMSLTDHPGQLYYEEELAPFLTANIAQSQKVEDLLTSDEPISQYELDMAIFETIKNMQLNDYHYENITRISKISKDKISDYGGKVDKMQAIWNEQRLLKHFDNVANKGMILDYAPTEYDLKKPYNMVSLKSSIKIVKTLLDHCEKAEQMQDKISTLSLQSEIFDAMRRKVKEYNKMQKVYQDKIDVVGLVSHEVKMSTERVLNTNTEILKREIMRSLTMSKDMQEQLVALMERQLEAFQKWKQHAQMRMATVLEDLEEAKKEEL